MTHFEDNFAQIHLPPVALQPVYLKDHPFYIPDGPLNCVEDLLDRHIREGNGQRIALRTADFQWTYQELFEKANQIAHVLKDDLGLISGNRVLLRSANNPMMVACWFGVIKAGGIVVATMPLLRYKELKTIVECAEISHVLCDYRLEEEVQLVDSDFLESICTYDGSGQSQSVLEQLMEDKPVTFQNYSTQADSVSIIGFTSGTTGLPKMTAHFHRDILAICKAFPSYSLQPQPEDIFTGSPPLGFTFGLGGLVLFPLYYGASTFLIEKPSPDLLLEAISVHKVSICFTAPTAWRILVSKVKGYDISSLRKCVSAGEALPPKVWQDWFDTTGLKIIDGIGATEMLHIFISSNEETMKKGALGLAIPGYEAIVMDENGDELPTDQPGRLAVRGITGCKYLNREEKQREYVQHGWNLTGDIFKRDADGYFWYIARGDSMIISSGYNIAAIEVESVLIGHPEIVECAVIGLPDEERGMIVCACIVLHEPAKASAELAAEIQNWFKAEAAPYKYPREIRFIEAIPKTETGKTQHFKLRQSNP
jgi:2-aminobenzoate-CoA ligase